MSDRGRRLQCTHSRPTALLLIVQGGTLVRAGRDARFALRDSSLHSGWRSRRSPAVGNRVGCPRTPTSERQIGERCATGGWAGSLVVVRDLFRWRVSVSPSEFSSPLSPCSRSPCLAHRRRFSLNAAPVPLSNSETAGSWRTRSGRAIMASRSRADLMRCAHHRGGCSRL